MFDLRVLSTLGLSEEDIAVLAAVDGVEAVQAVKYQDMEAQWQGQSETAVVRLQQLPAECLSNSIPDFQKQSVRLIDSIAQDVYKIQVLCRFHVQTEGAGSLLTCPLQRWTAAHCNH